MKLKAAEEARYNDDMEKILGNYEYPRTGSHQTAARDSHTYTDSGHSHSSHSHSNRLSSNSLYSEVTGNPRRTAEPRQPVKNTNLLSSRFSMTSYGSDNSQPNKLIRPPLPATDAEAYAASIRESPEPRGPGGSKNPFWK